MSKFEKLFLIINKLILQQPFRKNCLLLFILFIGLNTFGQNNLIQFPDGYNTISGIDTSGFYLHKSKISVAVSYTLKINEICANNGTTFADEYGEFDDWVEIYNYGTEDINLEGLYFSDDLSNPTRFRLDSSLSIKPGGFVVLWADQQVSQGRHHLSFKLSSSGESFKIYDDVIGLIDVINFGQQNYNISYGRQPDGSTNLNYFTSTTPNSSNISQGLYDIVPEPIVSINSGFYSSLQNVVITEPLSGCDIYYTQDGSIPNVNSTLYTSPLVVNTTTNLRVRAFKNNYIPSNTVTQTYIFDEKSTIPVLYITSEKSDIWQANDVPVHAELIDENNTQLFSLDAGSQLHGDKSFKQKSFKLYFRSMYGQNEVNKQLFKNKNVSRFKRLIFRAAGNDGLATSSLNRAHMRDGIIHTLANKANLKFKSTGYRSLNVYFNGTYWGVYNMRERPDKYFIEDNYNYDADLPMNLIEYAFGYTGNIHVVEGETADFLTTQLYCENEDLSIQSNYDYVDQRFDIDDFTDYWIYETYIGNFDWLSNNITFWKPIVPEGKYRWILWDTDHGIGFPYCQYGSPDWNTLEWATSTGSGRPWNGAKTRIIRGLLDNDDYKYYFITRFSDLLNKYFTPDYFTEIIDSLKDIIKEEVPKQIARWGGSTFKSWEDSFTTIRDYVEDRPDYVRDHIKNKFMLSDMYELSLDVYPENSGKFNFNTITVASDFPWKGKYYKTMKIAIEAVPLPGYQFVGWQNLAETGQQIEIYPFQDTNIIAVFEPISNVFSIIINEISYKQDMNFPSDDWIELYNKSDKPTDMSGWIFKDSDENHRFKFPTGITLNGDEYLVVCSDKIGFTSTYPNTKNYIGAFDFGLSGAGELIRLYNAEGDIVDSVIYDDELPWPTAPDGDGPTLELINPFYNNDLGENWQASYVDGGTPGIINSTSVTVIEKFSFDEILIYPNPTNGLTNIYSKNDATIIIYDISGKSHLRANITKGVNSFDLSKLNKGIYFVKIVSNKNSTIMKIIKL